MIKRAAACLLAVFFLFAAGCAENQGTVSMDVGQVADEVVKAVKFKDQMSAIEQKTAVKLYGLSEGDIVKAKVYESTGATAEEVAAFEAKNADAVRKAVAKRVEDQKAGFQGYQPREMEKLKNPLIVQKGQYIILVVADNTSAAQKVIDGFMK